MSKLDQLRAWREAQTKPPAAVKSSNGGVAAERTTLSVQHEMPRVESRELRPGPLEAKRKAGRPLATLAHLTIEAQKPWLADGMSRRTWYRRRRNLAIGSQPTE